MTWTPTNILITVGFMLTTIMIALQGCDLRQTIKVDAPKEVLVATQHEGKLTLDQADVVIEDWTYYVKTNTERLQASVDAAEERYATVHQILSVGLQTAGEASGGIPYGGLVFGLLTGLTGLMMPQPKFATKAKKEVKNEG